jgi:integrase
MDYKSPHVSPKTINSTYDPVTSHMDKCRTDGLKDPIEVPDGVTSRLTTESQARRTLMQLSAACKWA